MFLYFGESTTLLALIYVYDILITGGSPTQISSLITKLDSVFALRDLGRLFYFLGIKVSYNEGSIHLSQTKYTSDLLHRIAMFDTKPAKPLVLLDKIYPGSMVILWKRSLNIAV